MVIAPRPSRETCSPPSVASFMSCSLCRVPADGRSVAWSRGVVVVQRRRQLPVGVGLGEQGVGLLLDRADGVGAGGPPWRWLLGAGELHQGRGELGGVPALLAVHPVPDLDGLLGALG